MRLILVLPTPLVTLLLTLQMILSSITRSLLALRLTMLWKFKVCDLQLLLLFQNQLRLYSLAWVHLDLFYVVDVTNRIR